MGFIFFFFIKIVKIKYSYLIDTFKIRFTVNSEIELNNNFGLLSDFSLEV